MVEMAQAAELVKLGTWALAVTAGSVVGYFWGLSLVIPSGLRRLGVPQSVGGLITAAGPMVLDRWRAQPDPISGFFWVAGLVVGVMVSELRIRRAMVDNLVSQTGEKHRPRIKAIVASKLIRLGADVTEVHALDAIKPKGKPNERMIPETTVARLHDFIHSSRDVAVLKFTRLAADVARVFGGGAAGARANFVGYLDHVLSEYLAIMTHVTGDADGLWVAVRMLTTDDQGRLVYETVCRKGDVDQSRRTEESQPIPADCGVPRMLEDNLNNGPKETRGILILGPNDKKKRKGWMKMANDHHHEDDYLMAAPITLKRIQSDGKLSRQMVMILFANHRENRFFPWHGNVVRCCVDTLSMALSVGFQMLSVDAEPATPEPVRVTEIASVKRKAKI